MAQSDCQRVRGVVGTGNVFQFQKGSHHLLNLFFIGAAVSRQRLLDLHGRVFVQSAALFDASQKGHAARMGDRDARRDIFREKQFLQSDFFGRKTVDDLIHTLFENGEADGQRFLFGRLHNAVIDGAAVAVSVLVHYPVSHCGDPGIDTQYNHISSLYAPKRLDNFIET